MAGPANDAAALAEAKAARRREKRLKRFDTPWMNPKLLTGAGIIIGILLFGLFGRILWDPDLVFIGSAPLNLPPLGFENLRGEGGVSAHPLGTQSSGRDILALLIVGAPNTLFIGIIASLFTAIFVSRTLFEAVLSGRRAKRLSI